MSTISKLGKAGMRILHRKLVTPGVLAQMKALSADPRSANLIAAMDATFDHVISQEENSWVQRIEGLRAETEAIRKPISAYVEKDIDEELKPETHLGLIDPDSEVIVGELCREASKRPDWAMQLFHIIRKCKPQHSIELGTCLGMSALYEGAALRLNGSGKLVTMEGSALRASVARKNIHRLGLQSEVTINVGRFSNTLPVVLEEMKTIDYAFIDGHHNEQATKDYLAMIKPHVPDGGIMIFDDISWSDGMQRAWAHVIADEDVFLAIDLFKVGICVMSKKAEKKHTFKIAFD